MSSTIRFWPSAAAVVYCALLSAGAGAQQVFETVHLDGEEAIQTAGGPGWHNIGMGSNGHAVFITRNQLTGARTVWRRSPGSAATPLAPVHVQYDGISGVGRWPMVTAVDASGNAVIVDWGLTPDGGNGFIFSELIDSTITAVAATESMATGPGVLGVQTAPSDSLSMPSRDYIDRNGIYLGRLLRHLENSSFQHNQLIWISPGNGVRLHRTPGTPVPGGIGVFGDRSSADSRSTIFYRGALATTFDITPSGDAVYFSRIVEPTGEVRGGGIFREGPDGLRLLARNDIPDPSRNRMFSPYGLSANDAGVVVYKGTGVPAGAADPVFGIWRIDADGDVEPLILPGDPIPWRQAGIDVVHHYDTHWPKQQLALSESGDAIVRLASSDSTFTATRVSGVMYIHIRPDGDAGVLMPQYRNMEPHEAPYRAFTPDHIRQLIADDARSLLTVASVQDHDGTHAGAMIVAHVDYGVREIVRRHETIEVAPGDTRQVDWMIPLEHKSGGKSLIRLGFTDGSSGVFYTTVTAPACPADLTGNGVVDADDFFLFLQFFAAGHPRADINGDGVIDTDDFFDYLDLFSQGC